MLTMTETNSTNPSTVTVTASAQPTSTSKSLPTVVLAAIGAFSGILAISAIVLVTLFCSERRRRRTYQTKADMLKAELDATASEHNPDLTELSRKPSELAAPSPQVYRELEGTHRVELPSLAMGDATTQSSEVPSPDSLFASGYYSQNHILSSASQARTYNWSRRTYQGPRDHAIDSNEPLETTGERNADVSPLSAGLGLIPLHEQYGMI
jgi:hypothetical protein